MELKSIQTLIHYSPLVILLLIMLFLHGYVTLRGFNCYDHMQLGNHCF